MLKIDTEAPKNLVARRGGRERSELRTYLDTLKAGEWLHTDLKANGKNGKANLRSVNVAIQGARRKGEGMSFSTRISADDHTIHVYRAK